MTQVQTCMFSELTVSPTPTAEFNWQACAEETVLGFGFVFLINYYQM